MSSLLRLPILLLITENSEIRSWFKTHLEHRYFLSLVESYRQTIAALDGKIDYIVIDAEIQFEDPLALSMEIRQKIQKFHTPLFLLTGRLKKSYREKARKSGITDFLQPPLDPLELIPRFAIAEKTAQAREKTSGLASSLRERASKKGASLEEKLVLPETALSLLSAAKKEKSPVALFLFEAPKKEELFSLEKELPSHLHGHLNHAIIHSKKRLLLLILNMGEKEAKLLERILRQKFVEEKKSSLVLHVSILEPGREKIDLMLQSAIKSFRAQKDSPSHFGEH